ncbi:hypothetical protein L873DRAFT_1337401 [Choiromyces venosus 120613-1]|uniref:Uncharacterized protein n=1 Tax=Choiromyces venosus 120613-1 TaxID=1336337 RepID=A0A3N4JEJ6_9PEZI|nr:hypothetical protein L873DRAFT_1337401 [Choiromyces venosus 120613-1]
MSTSTSTSNATPLPPRIKLNQSGATGTGQRTYTGKHPPPGHSSRSNGSGTKTRPPPLPSPTPTVSGGNAGNGGGANGVNANSAGTRISERRRANKAGGPGKLKGGNVDDRVKGAGGDIETETEIVPRPIKKLPTKPYVDTTSVILQKYQGQPPSIVLHLHPQHFRFEGQDGGFGYGSPMRV